MNRTGLTYRTPADVRAIPNEQWGRWFTAGTNPLRLHTSTKQIGDRMRALLEAQV